MNTEELILVSSVLVVGLVWLLRFKGKQRARENNIDAALDVPSSCSMPQEPKEYFDDSGPATQFSQDSQPVAVQKPVSYAFLDIETTGLDSESDRITEICVFVITVGSTEHSGKSTLINPGRALTPFITSLTGITDEMLKDQPDESCLHEYFDFLGDRTVYTYNAEFDMGFLRAAAKRIGRQFNNPSSCIMERVKAEFPNLRSYKLQDVCAAFNVEVDQAAHRAEGDVMRALRVWNEVNNGHEPNPLALRPDYSTPEYGVYGHYRRDGLIFYVWTARNGEATTPDADFIWSDYVENHLQGQFEVRSIKSNLTFGQAIEAKDRLLAEHANTLLNRVNPHRGIITENHKRSQQLQISCNRAKAKASQLEAPDPSMAIELYQQALAHLNEYAEIVTEAGLFGEVTQTAHKSSRGGEALRILDRISLLLCKAKRHAEARVIAQAVFQTYPGAIELKAAATITKRISKGLP